MIPSMKEVFRDNAPVKQALCDLIRHALANHMK